VGKINILNQRLDGLSQGEIIELVRGQQEVNQLENLSGYRHNGLFATQPALPAPEPVVVMRLSRSHGNPRDLAQNALDVRIAG